MVSALENKSQITLTLYDVRSNEGKENMTRRKKRSATRRGHFQKDMYYDKPLCTHIQLKAVLGSEMFNRRQ